MLMLELINDIARHTLALRRVGNQCSFRVQNDGSLVTFTPLTWRRLANGTHEKPLAPPSTFPYYLPPGPPSFPHPLLLILSSTLPQIPSTTSLSLHLPCTPNPAFHFSTCALTTPLPHPFTVPGTSSPLHPT